LTQDDSAELLPDTTKDQKIFYAAYSPLAGGFLTGKYRLGQIPESGSRLDLFPEPYRRFLNQETFQRIEQLAQKARSSGRSMAQESLHFVLNVPGIDAAIIAPRKREHFENLGFNLS
jgi:aryl-alcohol dehydrogenase-like predicted oxidoreductase